MNAFTMLVYFFFAELVSVVISLLVMYHSTVSSYIFYVYNIIYELFYIYILYNVVHIKIIIT